jgi:hypothetical protein
MATTDSSVRQCRFSIATKMSAPFEPKPQLSELSVKFPPLSSITYVAAKETRPRLNGLDQIVALFPPHPVRGTKSRYGTSQKVHKAAGHRYVGHCFSVRTNIASRPCRRFSKIVLRRHNGGGAKNHALFGYREPLRVHSLLCAPRESQFEISFSPFRNVRCAD